MTYLTGSASSLENLVGQLGSFASINGWTFNNVNPTTNTITKGSISFNLNITGTTVTRRLSVKAITPAGATTQPGIKDAQWGNPKTGTTTWPATFHFFIYTNPDMICVVLNHDTNYFQHMMFGYANSLGSIGDGSGKIPFYWATFHSGEATAAASANMCTNVDGAVSTQWIAHEAIPFSKVYGAAPSTQAIEDAGSCGSAYLNDGPNFFINTVFNAAAGKPWVGSGHCCFNDNRLVPGNPQIVQDRQPNAWNNESLLSPIRVFGARPSAFFSPLFELAHVRIVRNDFYNDGDIITLGPDQWKVFSGRRKFPTRRTRAGTNTQDDSGTWALAFEYVP